VAPYNRAVLFNEMTISFHKSAHALLSVASTVTDKDGTKARELAEAGNNSHSWLLTSMSTSLATAFPSILGSMNPMSATSTWSESGGCWGMFDSRWPR